MNEPHPGQERPANAMPSKDCDTLLLLIPAYAMGATDPDETTLVESLLPHCPEALVELETYRAMADDWRATVPQLDPASDLGSRIMAAANSTYLPGPARAKPAFKITPPWAILAAALLLLIVSNVYWLARTNDLSAQMQEQREALILSQEVRWTRLASASGASESAWMMWNPQSASGVLYANNFPVLPVDQVYQLWLRNDAGRINGGIFRVNEGGFGMLVVKADAPIDDFQIAGITNEPEGGSEGPTGTAVVRGDL